MMLNQLLNIIEFVMFSSFFLFMISIILISNSIPILAACLVIIVIIKIFYTFFGKHIVSLLENNKYMNTSVQLLIKFISDVKLKLNNIDIENISINMGIIIIAVKIAIILFLKMMDIDLC